MRVNDQAREKARYWLDKIRGDLDGDVKKWRRLRAVPDAYQAEVPSTEPSPPVDKIPDPPPRRRSR